MTIGERIKKLRKKLGFTQQILADRISQTRNTVARYEIGIINPSPAVIALICREFNVREEWLREGEGEMFADEDASLLAQIAAEYHLDEKSRAMMANFLKLSDYERAVIVQASEIMAKKFAAQVAAGASEPPQTAAEKQQTEMHELTAEEWANIQRERTAREFEKAAAGSLDSAG